MPNPTDLVSLAEAQNWAGNANPTFTAQLITSVSRQILSWLQRPSILPKAYTETFNSNGQTKITLSHWPVLSVSSVIVNHVVIPPIEPPADTSFIPSFPNYGYLVNATGDSSPPGSPQQLSLFNVGTLYRWPGEIVVSYMAGYQSKDTQTIAGEALTALQPYGDWASDQGVIYAYPAQNDEVHSVPTTGPYTSPADNTLGTWTFDLGVVYASNNIPLTRVPNSPATGQYSVANGIYTFAAGDAGVTVLISYRYVPTPSPIGAPAPTGEALTVVKGAPAVGQYSLTAGSGNYTFNAADNGESVILSYGYIPADIANAAAQWVSELVSYQGRIGLRSKSLGGQETISYLVNAMPPMVQAALWPYRKVIL